MQISHKTSVIKCPKCGAEFLPGEIYMPGSLIGQPTDIIRDSLGKIIYEDYPEDAEPDVIEHFICDQCNTPFAIEASIAYRTSFEAPEKDFQNSYVPLI